MRVKDFEIPILFLVFNRPELTHLVFNQIKKIKPKKLYVASDGPRHDHNEKEIVNQVRGIATNITWECDLKLHYSEMKTSDVKMPLAVQ